MEAMYLSYCGRWGTLAAELQISKTVGFFLCAKIRFILCVIKQPRSSEFIYHSIHHMIRFSYNIKMKIETILGGIVVRVSGNGARVMALCQAC
jgi:hypothetical protein